MSNTEQADSRRGFMLAEIVAAVAIGLCISLLLGPTFSRYETYLAKMQLRGAARELAADLNALQQRALFRASSDTEMLMVTGKKDGYKIILRDDVFRRVNFGEEGVGPVYFTVNAPRAVYFGKEGSPVFSGSSNYYKLVHKAQSDLAITVSVQPVTGRVVVCE